MIALELWTLDLISSSLLDTNGLSCQKGLDFKPVVHFVLWSENQPSIPVLCLASQEKRHQTDFSVSQIQYSIHHFSIAREALQSRNEDPRAQAHFQPYWPALPLRSGFWGVLINKIPSWGVGQCVPLKIMTLLTTVVKLNPAMHVFSLEGRGWANASDGVVLLKYL